MCVSVEYVRVSSYLGGLERPAHRAPGATVAVHREQPDIQVGKQTWVFCRSNVLLTTELIL